MCVRMGVKTRRGLGLPGASDASAPHSNHSRDSDAASDGAQRGTEDIRVGTDRRKLLLIGSAIKLDPG